MPINKKDYPPEWDSISWLKRNEAGWKCEWCGIGQYERMPTGGRCVLTVAHLGAMKPDGTRGDKHDKHDVRSENLASLCQSCHLKYDIEDHMRHARETRTRLRLEAYTTRGQLPLFEDDTTVDAYRTKGKEKRT